MEALDTNVIVRIATRDDEKQLRLALDLVKGRFSRESPAWISLIVIVEFSWVLKRLYNYPRAEVADAIASLLNTRELLIEDAPLVTIALSTFRNSKADFADCLIEARNSNHGIRATHTFDITASKLPGFQRIS